MAAAAPHIQEAAFRAKGPKPIQDQVEEFASSLWNVLVGEMDWIFELILAPQRRHGRERPHHPSSTLCAAQIWSPKIDHVGLSNQATAGRARCRGRWLTPILGQSIERFLQSYHRPIPVIVELDMPAAGLSKRLARYWVALICLEETCETVSHCFGRHLSEEEQRVEGEQDLGRGPDSCPENRCARCQRLYRDQTEVLECPGGQHEDIRRLAVPG